MQENITKKFKINIFKTKNYWRNLDKQIFVSFIFLFTLGLFFSFSSTSFIADERLNKEYYFFFQKHLLYAFLSFSLMISISLCNTNFLNKVLFPIFLIFFITMVLVPFFGVEVKGAKRWLNLYIFRFQPIEFLKPFFILVVAQIISSHFIKNLNLSYFLSFLLLSLIVLLLISQPDLGQSVLIICAWISTIFISGFNIYLLLMLFTFIILLFSTLVYFLPDKFNYIITRITSFLNPEKSENFQSSRATEAIREGSLKGQGMGEGILKESVPEAHTDFAFAVVGEQLGFIGAMAVLILLGTIILTGFRTAQIAPDVFGSLLAAGISIWFLVQVLVNLLGVLRLAPITGVTLPFISYGGTSLIINALAAGLLLNIARQSQ